MKVTSEILDRLPPQDLDAERAVLCSILLDPTELYNVGFLRPEDFYAVGHQTLYAAFLELSRHEGAIDPVTLAAYLRTTGGLEVVGGMAYLLEVAQAVAVSLHAAHYAGIVKQKSRARQIIHATTDLLRDAYEPTSDVDELLGRTERVVATLRDSNTEDRSYTAQEAADEAVGQIADAMDRKESRGVMTGLVSYDAGIGGLFPGELTILAARPGIGKSSLAMQIADHNGAKNRPVLFCSLEMSKAELATWRICGLAGVPRQAVRNASVDAEQLGRIREAGSVFGGFKMRIYDRAGMGLADILREARKQKRNGLTLLVVDYLQLVAAEDKRAPREQQVATLSRGLKTLAGELEIPVLCLCQLNRQAEDGEEPKLRHLRESGAIEQDAAMVLFLWRTKDCSRLGVAKNRATGVLGTFDLRWDDRSASYESIEPANYDPDLGNYGAPSTDEWYR